MSDQLRALTKTQKAVTMTPPVFNVQDLSTVQTDRPFPEQLLNVPGADLSAGNQNDDYHRSGENTTSTRDQRDVQLELEIEHYGTIPIILQAMPRATDSGATNHFSFRIQAYPCMPNNSLQLFPRSSRQRPRARHFGGPT